MIRRLAPAILLGAAAGVVSGLFGVGGGVIIVPGLVLGLRLDQYSASGTSVATIVASATTGVISFALDGKVDWAAAGALFIGAGLGAWVGARFSTRVPEHVLAGAFAIVLLVAAVRLWV